MIVRKRVAALVLLPLTAGVSTASACRSPRMTVVHQGELIPLDQPPLTLASVLTRWWWRPTLLSMSTNRFPVRWRRSSGISQLPVDLWT